MFKIRLIFYIALYNRLNTQLPHVRSFSEIPSNGVVFNEIMQSTTIRSIQSSDISIEKNAIQHIDSLSRFVKPCITNLQLLIILKLIITARPSSSNVSIVR